jgi:choline kinase
MKIIIPSAKLVSEELQKIGRLPAIIYPVNGGIVFDYLYRQYRDACDGIDIICFEKEDTVRQRLIKYNDEKINIESLAELSDLGHTIYYGLKNIHGSIVINFADTIVFDNIFENSGNCFYYSKDYPSATWTFFKINDGYITDIYDKSDDYKNTFEKEKLFVGVFQLSDADYFRECLENAFDNRIEEISTFYQALQKYSEKYLLEAIPTNNWFDIGHVDKYYSSQLEVKAREFNHITIDKDRGILKKTSDDIDKFIGEIKWYLKLPADIEYVRPRIFDYSISYTNPYINMEYYAYHTVHELFLYGDLSCHQWVDIFNRIRFVYCDFKRYSLKDNNISASLEEMYLIKTISRLENVRKQKNFHKFWNKTITVNGKKYKSLGDICSIIKEQIPKMLYDVETFHIIHGDLCFTNMMIDDNFSFIKVIDPRGKFGQYDIYGDSRYELAKLFHSIDGKYDCIIKDLILVDFNEEEAIINYQILDRKRDYDLYQIFMSVFKDEIGAELKKIEFIEALLFFSMIPLHRESITHQMAMLGTGIEILSRVVNILE